MNLPVYPEIKGGIFDMDGTLLDSMEVWDKVCNEYLIRKNITPEPGLADVFKKMTLPEAAVYYRENYGIRDSVHKICNDINHMVAFSYSHTVKPKDGALLYLKQLKRRGTSVFVATVTDASVAESAFENTGLIKYIDGIITTEMAGAPKTSPRVYEECLKRMNIEKKDSMVFEDSLHAIKTAANAGFPVTAVFDRSSEKEWNEIKKTASFSIRSFRELLNAGA